jgi:hypothetical protein
VDLKVKDAATDNQMWSKDPDQKLIYSAVVKWARRHCPEVVLGIITDDDMERMIEEAAAQRAPVAPSSLDIFAAAGARPLGPTPSHVIDLTGAGAPAAASTATTPAAPSNAPSVVAEGSGSDEQGGAATPAAAEATGEAGASAAPTLARLTEDKVGKLRALIQAEPAVAESAVARGLGQEGRALEDLEGQPGETSQALYTRVLDVTQGLKKDAKR